MDRMGSEDELDFATFWTKYGDAYSYAAPRRGDIREATVLRVSLAEVVLDVGAKQDAVLIASELANLSPSERDTLRVGQMIPVYVQRLDGQTGRLLVSIEMAREYGDWLRAEALLESGEIVQAPVIGYNKGGLLCEFGRIQGFVPASQVLYGAHPGRQGDASSLVGSTLALKVIEVNRNRRRLILSERAAAREWRVQQREHLLEEIEVGETRTGTVSNLCEFGAFVDLGGVDGLVHLSELSWEHISHPREVVQIGDTVQVLILNIDYERQRIGLSLKRTQPDPWEKAAALYPLGATTMGIVTHVVSFGVFVSLLPGVEGLIHASELQSAGLDPLHAVVEGEQVAVTILGLDAADHRVSLGLHHANQDASGAEPDQSEEEVA